MRIEMSPERVPRDLTQYGAFYPVACAAGCLWPLGMPTQLQRQTLCLVHGGAADQQELHIAQKVIGAEGIMIHHL